MDNGIIESDMRKTSCTYCGKSLRRDNRSGYCHKHHQKSPEYKKAHVALFKKWRIEHPERWKELHNAAYYRAKLRNPNLLWERYEKRVGHVKREPFMKKTGRRGIVCPHGIYPKRSCVSCMSELERQSRMRNHDHYVQTYMAYNSRPEVKARARDNYGTTFIVRKGKYIKVEPDYQQIYEMKVPVVPR